jgi:hypothetical protein
VKNNNIDIKTTEEEDTISRNDKYNSSSSFPENNLLHKAVFEGILGLEEQMQHYYHSLDLLHRWRFAGVRQTDLIKKSATRKPEYIAGKIQDICLKPF